MKKLITGNEAAALAAKLARPQLIAAYPITPQTSIAEKLAEYTAGGRLKARYIKVESETSALAACIGGSLSGARVFTATSSQGLALMHELLHWASGARLPIVIVNVNRSMAAPWSLGVDHNDTLSQRDTGCLQIYCETAQEVMDTILMAYKLAEAVILPILICMDGFLLSHYSEPVQIPDQEEVDRFLPRRRAKYRMDPKAPCTFGGGVSSEVLYQLRQRMQEDMDGALLEHDRTCRQFYRRFGRRYLAVETIKTKESNLALITNGTMAGTVKAYIKEKGHENGVGLIKVRLFRPFPKTALKEALKGFKKAVVIDRNLSPGGGGIFSQEIKASLYGTKDQIPLVSVIGGLGGVDVTPDHLDRLVGEVLEQKKVPPETIWMEA
ncbi:MAG: pyruvate ferredoxin oxidoreductase [Deltaproteobacteria bacterium]|nr:pyruvate ferredoxin oxidoreductase [Deltaproteobacteria bacterium]